MKDITKRIVTAKIFRETDDWISKLANQCAINENKRIIAKAEILRRISKVNGIDDILIKDSFFNKRRII